MVREGIISFPIGAKDTPVQGLRKRGRPKSSEIGRPPKASKQKRFA